MPINILMNEKDSVNFMKKRKIFAFLLVGYMMFSFASCGDEQIDTTTTETTKTSETIIAETTTVHTWNYPDPIAATQKENKGESIYSDEQSGNEFEAFYTLDSDDSLLEDRKRYPILTIEEYLEEWPDAEPVIILFRVLAKEVFPSHTGHITYYYIQLVDAYGNVTYDSERQYYMGYDGTETRQRYGMPTLELGKIYALFWCRPIDGENGFQEYFLNRDDTLWIFPIFDVAEIDGKRYLYSTGKDLSSLECAIPITDPEENSVYKVGKHDKQIAELDRLGIPLPTYDYKCEIDAFFTEYMNGIK